MIQDPTFTHYGSTEALLRAVKGMARDIRRAEIPQHPFLTLLRGGRPWLNVPVGMVLHLADGTTRMLTRHDAEAVLNDGVLSRLRVRIELHNPLAGR